MIVGIVDRELVAAALRGIESVGCGGLVEHDGNRRLVACGQDLPRIGHSGRVGPAKTAAGDESRSRAEHSRLSRLIEVQAACVVARLDTEGVESTLGQEHLLLALETKFLAALRRIEIVVDRPCRSTDEGEAAAAAGALGGFAAPDRRGIRSLRQSGNWPRPSARRPARRGPGCGRRCGGPGGAGCLVRGQRPARLHRGGTPGRPVPASRAAIMILHRRTPQPAHHRPA